jgi:hypothetical protein
VQYLIAVGLIIKAQEIIICMNQQSHDEDISIRPNDSNAIESIHYKVVWEVDIFDAMTPEEAALSAFDLIRHHDTTATVFTVIAPDQSTTTVDILDL